LLGKSLRDHPNNGCKGDADFSQYATFFPLGSLYVFRNYYYPRKIHGEKRWEKKQKKKINLFTAFEGFLRKSISKVMVFAFVVS